MDTHTHMHLIHSMLCYLPGLIYGQISLKVGISLGFDQHGGGGDGKNSKYGDHGLAKKMISNFPYKRK